MKSTVSLQGQLAEREFQQLPLVLQLLKKHNCCSCRNLQSAGNKCKLRNTLENMLINDYQSFSSITSLFFFKDFFRFLVLDGQAHESWKCINRASLTDVYMYMYILYIEHLGHTACSLRLCTYTVKDPVLHKFFRFTTATK